MSGSDHPSRAGRLAALATLAVSASLFLTALFGISSIDPGADVSTPARGLSPTQSISLDPAATDRGHDGDCPWRDRGGASGEQPRQRSTS